VRDDDRLGAAILSVCRAWHLQDDLGQYTAALSMAVNARRELTLLGAIPHAMAAGLVAANSAVALSDRATADAELRLMADAALRPETRVLTGWRHIVQGELHNDYDELPESNAELTRARDVLHETGERVGYAFATAYLSRACRRQEKLGPARILADEALEEFAHYGAEHAYTVALDARAEVGVELGHGDEALEQATNALSRAVAAQDAFMTARATRTRARALRVLVRLDEAAEELTRSIDMFAAIDRTLSVAATLYDLAIVQDLLGQPGAASESLRQERKALEHARLERSDVLRGQIR
jgi:tetratricopeptide (TPR) repeat protein